MIYDQSQNNRDSRVPTKQTKQKGKNITKVKESTYTSHTVTSKQIILDIS